MLGLKEVGFDIYDYRGEKLRDKLESILKKGNICCYKKTVINFHC